MEKRYQVFVSSTYADLQEERSSVFQTLMKMDCIPSGMELFPAIDEEQFEFIKKVINDCDYYVLIIGGRYGSLAAEGISYTKKEYDYAIDRGIKVIAFIHKNPDELPVAKSEIDVASRQKLLEFRTEVSKGRLVNFWNSAKELPGLVALSLLQTIKTYPAEGWVRANQMPTTELLSEINGLRKRNTKLESEVNELRDRYSNTIKNLSSFDDTFKVYGYFKYERHGIHTQEWNVSITWRALFGLVSPFLMQHPNDSFIKILLQKNLSEMFLNNEKNTGYGNFENTHGWGIDDQLYQTIKIQLMAYGLVKLAYSKTTKGGMALFWSLTPKGQSVMMQVRSVKSDS
jgi:hypothetical protein